MAGSAGKRVGVETDDGALETHGQGKFRRGLDAVEFQSSRMSAGPSKRAVNDATPTSYQRHLSGIPALRMPSKMGSS